MKRLVALLLALLMLLSLSLANAEDDELLLKVDALWTSITDGTAKFSEETPIMAGDVIVAVCSDLGIQLSTDAEDVGFYGMSFDHLAFSLDSADWLYLIYPRSFSVRKAGGNTSNYVGTYVCTVNLHNGVMYKPYSAAVHTAEEGSELLDAFDPQAAVDDISLKIEAFENGDYGLYMEAEQYYAEEKYYSAYVSYISSGFYDWEAKAASCRKTWPKNGEIWHDSGTRYSGTPMELTVHVNQEDDIAYFVRIYKDGKQVSCLFIGGTGEASTKLPGGTYVIKDGSGRNWYGIREAFGREGSYETWTFDETGTEEIRLQAGHSYTLTVNIQSGTGNADSYDMDFDSFAE